MNKTNQKPTVDPVGDITSIPHKPVAFILQVSSPHKFWAISAILIVIFASFIGASIPFLFRKIVDTATAVSAGTAIVSDVWFWAIWYPIAVLVMSLGWRSSGFVGMQWVTRANATAYNNLFRYLSSHSHNYFSNRFAGSLSSKVGHASDGTQSLCEAFIWNYFPTTLALVFSAVYIATANLLASGIFIGLVLLLIPLNLYLAKLRRPHVVKYSAQATKARGYAVDAITNISAVRQFSRREDEIAQFGGEIDNMRLLNLKQWRISEWTLVINNVIIVIFQALVVLVSVYAWTAGQMTIGELVMITTLLISVQDSLEFIGASMNGFIRRYGEVEEGLDEVVIPHEITDQPNAKKLTTEHAQVDWKHVHFSFGANRVFNDFNLTIEPGQRVGLVGPSGSGKTTFVSLLLRQHDLQGGAITIDGQNIAEVTQDSLRENIAVVPQEPLLFHRTIRENIAYGKPDATDEEIIAVAEKAKAHEFIVTLPEGYDTMVGERGVKLSGGQKQRVAIARAMLKNAPILVLDEATSALDSESEVAIQEALHELMVGKTVVAIAHRLSTLREMDRIIVLEQGKIVEDGNHETLAHAGGTYQRLWEHQAGGFLQE